MASATETPIEDLNRQSARLEAETRKLLAEASKLNAEQYKLSAERSKLETERLISPWMLLAQGLIAGAALLGAGAALTKLLVG